MTHAKKFKEFIRSLESAQRTEAGALVVHQPAVLGDNYEELVENLNLLADANVALHIVPRWHRRTVRTQPVAVVPRFGACHPRAGAAFQQNRSTRGSGAKHVKNR